jgi:hypothetical protein
MTHDAQRPPCRLYGSAMDELPATASPGAAQPGAGAKPKKRRSAAESRAARQRQAELRRVRDRNYRIRQDLGDIVIRNVAVNREKLGAKLYNAKAITSLADVDDPKKICEGLEKYLREWIDN